MVTRKVRGALLTARVAIVALLALAMIAGATLPAFAVGGQTGNVNGTIVDNNGAPVGGATITLAAPSGTYHTTTNQDGFFTITGVIVDTYTLTVVKSGYQTLTQQGITIVGDQTVGLEKLTMGRELRTIGRTTARSVNSAFQPTQTQDSFTFSGNKITEIMGKAHATNQTQLIAAAPGTQIDKLGNLTVRGSLTSEIGLNFDGVDYTDPDHGGAQNTFLNGIGSVTVNPGAGDVSSGNNGAGVINLIPKRGTRPAFGSLDFEAGTGNYYHQAAGEYGFATPSGKFSDYISFTGNNYDTYHGPFGYGPQQFGTASSFSNLRAGTQSVLNRDLLNNMVFRFGKNNEQSLQFLYQNHVDNEASFFGGPYLFANQNPLALASLGVDSRMLPFCPQICPLYTGQAPGQLLAPNSGTANRSENLKFEYDNNFNSTTFLALRYYLFNYINFLDDPSGGRESFGDARDEETGGGNRYGVNFELTKQLGERNILTLTGKYELQRPLFSINDPIGSMFALSGGGPVGRNDWVDFLTPPNPNAPLTFGPPGQANNCPVATGCWLYYYNTVVAPGALGPMVPRMPSNLLNSPNVVSQVWGTSIRDQIRIGNKLRLDGGVRYEGANYHLPPGILTGNIGPDNETNLPREVEPRLSANYQFDPSDSFRVGYGRSAIFLTLGSMYTPLNYQYYYNTLPNSANSLPTPVAGVSSKYNFVPAPFVQNGGPGSGIGQGCGSGEGPGGALPFRPCSSYADMIRWEQDWFLPDNGNARTSVYNNYDATYSHQFPGGYAFRVSPFYRRGYNIIFVGAAVSTTDPISGALIPLSFRPFFSGFTKATGAEFLFTTPDRPYGLTATLSATYVNAFSNRPAGAASEDFQPFVPLAALASGNAYRVGFLSPFVATLGAQYKLRNGIRFNPVFRYDRGFPYGSGNTTAVQINGVGLNVPSTNNPASVPVQVGSTTSAVNYIDPTNPGNLLAPNIYATRGTPETASPGGVLSHPRIYTDMTVEWAPGGGHNVFGVQLQNIGNTYYSEPGYNPRWQPIATGVGGIQTGQTSAIYSSNYNPKGLGPNPYGIYNYTVQQHGAEPYILNPNQQPFTMRFYYQVNF